MNLRPPEYEARVSTIDSEITFGKIGGGRDIYIYRIKIFRKV